LTRQQKKCKNGNDKFISEVNTSHKTDKTGKRLKPIYPVKGKKFRKP
jgi:hypothetical protein